MSTGEEEKGGKSPLRLAVIAGSLLALSVAAAAGGMAFSIGPAAFFSYFGGAEAAQAAPAEDHAEAPHGDDAHEEHGESAMEMLPLNEIIVNITALTLNGRKTSRFLKLNLAILYDTAQEGADRIAERQLYVRDTFQDYLRQLTESDLEGSAGLASMKAELLRRARVVTGSEAPREILVADMIIQ